MTLKHDLTGRQFGRLTVNSRASSKNQMTMWLCRCSCGKDHTVSSSNLMAGRITSCGCRKTEESTSHGLSGTRIYSIWLEMIRRCSDPKHAAYHLYGARGITVCERWLASVQNFLIDMGEPPTESHTLERSDGNAGYVLSNCRWATPKEQANNRSTNVNLTWRGETRTMKEWSEVLGINYQTLRYRINHGWAISEAFSGKRSS